MSGQCTHAALVGAIVIFASAVIAQTAGSGFDLSWHTIDGGGGTSVGGTFELSGTIGQPDAGAMSGGSFDLTGGFWPGLDAGVPTCALADVTCDGAVNVDDLLVVLNNWGECGDCSDCAADITGDCTVNVDDLLIVLNNWG